MVFIDFTLHCDSPQHSCSLYSTKTKTSESLSCVYVDEKLQLKITEIFSLPKREKFFFIIVESLKTWKNKYKGKITHTIKDGKCKHFSIEIPSINF
jgi:hypothetical protein